MCFLIHASQQTCVISKMSTHFTEELVEAEKSIEDNSARQA